MKDVLRQLVREGAGAVLPIALTVLALHVSFVPLERDQLYRFLAGCLFVGAGIALFLWGVRLGLVPLGEFIGSTLSARGQLVPILAAGLALGLIVAAADPDLRVLGHMVAGADPSISANAIVMAVATGIGVFVVVSMLRVFLQIPIRELLFGCYAVLFVLSALAPPALVPVAFDAGGVATGPVIVPFVLAFNVGVVSALATRDRLADSFGLVALTCVGPVLAVLIMAFTR